MRRLIAPIALGLAGLIIGVVPASAAGPGTHSQTTNWSQHDTAVYVVSTLNLLHTRSGEPATAIFQKKLDVTRYDVYADSSMTNMYYIQLKRDDSSVAGVFAYEIGWAKPQALYLSVSHICKHASQHTFQQYKADQKSLLLIGSFSSTIPS